MTGASVLAGVWLGPGAIPATLGIILVLQLVRGSADVRPLFVAAIAVAIGVARGGDAPDTDVPPNLILVERAWGRIDGMPKASPNGVRVDLRVDRVIDGEGREAPAEFTVLLWLPDAVEVASGDSVRVAWTVTPIDRLSPGFARYVMSRGAVASAYAWDVTVEERGGSLLGALGSLQERLTRDLRRVMPGDAGGLAAGIVTGNDASMSDAARDAFLRTGTTHLTAVSGSNVAMLLALWNMILRSSRTRRALVIQGLIVISIWLYAGMVGLEPSAVRAAIVASVGLFSGRFGRKADPLTILLLTIGGMALWNPDYTRMLGFWLSVIASFAFVSRLPASGPVTVRTAAISAAQGVLLAQVATLPLILVTFGTWSISSIVANIVIQPLMSLAFPLTFALAVVVLCVPAVAPVLAWIPAILLESVLAVVQGLAPLVAPILVERESPAALIGAGVPCGLIVIAASQDAERWARIIGERWPVSPRRAVVMVAVAGIGIVLGVTGAILI